MKCQLKIILLSLGLLTGISLQAQNLILSGSISFERKENIHKQMTSQNSWTEERLKHMPKYKIDQFQLHFTPKQSIYKITLEDESPMFAWMKIANSNTVKTDREHGRMEAEKVIYEKSYRVEDSLPQYQWKMMGEYRNIAGYNCRKASTIIMDSLYVIAFYTDEIPVSSGPETFNGLPGMILGIVLPRLNLTYFATKVEPQILQDNAFEMAKTRSKKIKISALNEELNKAIKDWGEYGSKVIWRANL